MQKMPRNRVRAATTPTKHLAEIAFVPSMLRIQCVDDVIAVQNANEDHGESYTEANDLVSKGDMQACFRTLCRTLSIPVPAEIQEVLGNTPRAIDSIQPNKRPRVDQSELPPWVINSTLGQSQDFASSDIDGLAHWRPEHIAAASTFLARCADYTAYLGATLTASADHLLTGIAESDLLLHAVMAAGSRNTEHMAQFHQHYLQRCLVSLQNTLLEKCSLMDFYGVLIYLQFLSNGQTLGHAVSLAYQLGLHRIGHRLLQPAEGVATRSGDDTSALRAWIQLYALDRMFATTSGCPV